MTFQKEEARVAAGAMPYGLGRTHTARTSIVRFQGVERSVIIVELIEKNAQQTGCTERRDRAAVDNRTSLARRR